MNITAVNSYTKKISFDLTKIRKVGIFLANMETPLQWYNRQTDKPTFVCNCGLFTYNKITKKYEPCYSLKIDGKILIQDSLYRGVGIKGTKLSMGTIQELDCEDFVSGAPVLTYNGQNQVTQAWIDTLSTIVGKEPRTILGWNDKELSVLCVDGRQTNKPGIDMKSMPKLCLDNGLLNAVNFDGGGSSMSVANGSIVNSPSENRGVYTVFAIWENNIGKITKLNIFGKPIDCDITLPLDYSMSNNFTLREFIDPTTRELIYDPILHFIMQTLRTERGWTINIESLYRGEKYNADVGGEVGSNHTKGCAVDFKAFVGKRQIDPIHVAYALKAIAERFNITYGLGTYMKGYDSGSLGFTHFDTRREATSLWVCYKKPTLLSISALTDIEI